MDHGDLGPARQPSTLPPPRERDGPPRGRCSVTLGVERGVRRRESNECMRAHAILAHVPELPRLTARTALQRDCALVRSQGARGAWVNVRAWLNVRNMRKKGNMDENKKGVPTTHDTHAQTASLSLNLLFTVRHTAPCGCRFSMLQLYYSTGRPTSLVLTQEQKNSFRRTRRAPNPASPTIFRVFTYRSGISPTCTCVMSVR